MEGIIFKFYLNFKNDNTGLIEITEVVKFDGASFTVEQDKGRYGRDVSFGNEEVNLVFYEGLYDTTTNPLQLPDASIVYNLTMGLPFLLDYYKTFGFESEVEFIIEKDGLTFTVGVLDFQLAKTDLLTYFETKIIQETKRATINRRKDTKVDVFSATDLDMEAIAPLVPVNVLLKAKPVLQISEWKSNPENADSVGEVSNFGLGGSDTFTLLQGANNANIVLKYGIEDTLSFISDRYTLVGTTSGELMPNDGLSYTYLEAREELSNVTIEITDLDAYSSQLINEPLLSDATVDDGSGYMNFVVKIGTSENDPDLQSYILYSRTFGFVPSSPVVNLPTSLTLNIPLITRGQRVWIFMEPFAEAEITTPPGEGDGLTFYRVNAVMNSMNVKISGTSTAIDSVIKGVRYIDVIKQNVLSISGMPVVAPRFDTGGEHFEQFAFNGYLIRQFTEKPFYVTFKQLMEDTQEINGDYQIKPNDVFLGEYPDFYPNNELAVYLQPSDDEFSSQFNERYTLVNAEFKYTNYEKDRDESNTIDSIHTETQYLFPNKLVENVKKITVDYIRDPFMIESSRRQGITTKDTTSLSEDDKMFLIDVVEFTDTEGGFTATLLQRVDAVTGKLQIMNSNGTSAGTFNWTLLGFEVGDTFEITTGDNAGTYTVETLEPTVLGLSTGASFSGVQSITVIYPYTDVQYVNRTNEDFISITNLAGGDNYSNLRYSIRRNIKHWESYFATASKYKPLGTIQNTYFKNNGLATTQFTGQPVYVENENIDVSDLEQAILSPLIYKTRVIVTFEEMVTLLEGLNTVNLDGSIGGFIRVVDTNDRVIKLHPTILDYEWSTNLLSITGEERNESDFVTVDTFGLTLVEINEVGYNTILFSSEWYKINGNYVTLFDANAIPLINTTRIEKVMVNGISYITGTDLAIALSNL